MFSLVKQPYYAEIDKKLLNEVCVNHIDNEMFTVQYAVVDRVAMASRVPQPAVVKVTSSNTQHKMPGVLLLLHM